MRVGQMAGVDDLQEATDEERKNRRQLDTELGDFFAVRYNNSETTWVPINMKRTSTIFRPQKPRATPRRSQKPRKTRATSRNNKCCSEIRDGKRRDIFVVKVK